MSNNKISGYTVDRSSAPGADGGAGTSSQRDVLFSFSGLQDQDNRYTEKTTHFRKLFFSDASCLTIMKGYSMGYSQIHVSVKRSATSTQKQALAESLKCYAVFFRCMEHWEECQN